MTKRVTIAILFVMACSAFLATTAEAALIITLTEASDGGVDLKATGTSDGDVGGDDNNVRFDFEPGIIPLGSNVDLTPAGSLEVAGNPYTVIAVVISANSGGEGLGPASRVEFQTINSVTPAGIAAADNIMASFPVADLAFADLTPGTYASTDVAGVSLVIVPEPASLALLIAGGATLLGRRRPRNASLTRTGSDSITG